MEMAGLIVAMIFCGMGIGFCISNIFFVIPLTQTIATMRKEGYIATYPAEPRPDRDEPWLDIAEG
jgi:hypothetical protein